MIADGETVTCPDEDSEMIALPVYEGSTVDTAVTVTLCGEGMDVGAVYSPVAEIEPTAGITVHVLAVLLIPEKLAVNCLVCPGVIPDEDGCTETVGGGRLTFVIVPLNAPACIVEFASYRDALANRGYASAGDEFV